MDDRLSNQIGKLSHEFEEIRVRALMNIISKLDLGLISEKDLISKSDIFVKLVNWFNLETVPCKKDVLGLLLRLVKESGAAVYLHLIDPGLVTLKKAVGDQFPNEFKEISECVESVQTNGDISPNVDSIEEIEPNFSTEDWVYKEIYWPVPQLEESDRRVLSSVASLLSDRSQSSQAANFLSTVLLHDFPPQVFLHHTAILNALFNLLKDEDSEPILSCFKELILSLHRQFNFYHDPVSIQNTCSTGNDDEETAVCQWSDNSIPTPIDQLGFGEFCALTLEKLDRKVPGSLVLLQMCIKDTHCFWESTSGSFIKSSISNHLVSLSTKLKLSRLKDPVNRLKIQIWISRLLETLIPTSVAASVVSKDLQEVMMEELLDPCLLLVFPSIHNSIKRYASSFQYLESNDYFEVESLIESLNAAAKFIHEGLNMPTTQALETLYLSISTLDIHTNYSLISMFFNLIADRTFLPSESELAEQILLCLLSHRESIVQEHTYSQLLSAVSNVLGPAGALCKDMANFEKILFFLSPTVLKELISFGITSSIPQVSENSETILTLALKAKSILSEENWSSLLASLATSFPLLAALADDNTPLGKCILQMFDPDVAPDLCLHQIQVLNGNVRLLFSKKMGIVSESYSRLVYLLRITPRATFSMPHPSFFPPHQYTTMNVFSEENVVGLVEVLKTTDGKMLKSAVIQVSLMSEQPSLHIPLLDAGVLPLLLDILSTALENYSEFAEDYYASIVVVLKNLAYHNIQLRNDFSVDYRIFSMVLKGLFSLNEGGRWVLDAVQLLALMAFSYLIQTTAGLLSFPKLIFDHLNIPFHIRTHSDASAFTLPSKKNLLVDRGDVCSLLGSVWCSAVCGGIAHVFSTSRKLPSLPRPLVIPSRKAFVLLRNDLEAYLIDLKLAKSHESASDALNLISSYVKLSEWSNEQLVDLEWEDSFKRYLITVPASPADQILLVQILQTLMFVIELVEGQVNWVWKYVSDSSNILCTLLTQTAVEDTTSLKKDLSLELLALVEKCLKVGVEEPLGSVGVILLQSLNQSHTHKFYSLAVVERLLGCLVCLAKSLDVPGSEGPLWKLLAAFHCPSPTSFMGLTITRRALFALNSIIAHSKEVRVHAEAVWLPKLLTSRDLIVVSTALELSFHLTKTQKNCTKLLEYFPNVWDITIQLLMDHQQSCLVREQAARLVSNIINYSQCKSYVSEAIKAGMFECFSVIFSRYNLKYKDEEVFLYHICNKGDKVEHGGASTKRLISQISSLALVLIIKDSSKVIPVANSSGLILALARDISSWQCEKLSDSELVEMYQWILKLLIHTHCSKSSPYLLEGVSTLIWLLLPSTYGDNVDKTGLITVSMKLLALILSTVDTSPDLVIPGEAIKTICTALLSYNSNLSLSALAVIPPLASHFSEKVSVELVRAVGSCNSAGKIAALASIVSNSHSATLEALEMGLLEESIIRLRGFQLTLSLTPRNTNKMMQTLEEVRSEFCLLTNLLAGCGQAKVLATSLGLADALHKLWVWAITDLGLLASLLRTLITFTADSPLAAGSLVLTSTLTGVGQRKSPTSSSLLHAIISALLKEVLPFSIKQLLLQLLIHAFQASESRNVIAKSNFLTEFISVSSQKKSGAIDEMEVVWLNFLSVFTSFVEGQASLIKNEEGMEKLLEYLSGTRGEKHKAPSLCIIRNLVFNQTYRQKFIISDVVIKNVSARLTDVDLTEDELTNIFLISWVISANSQRGKVSVKSAGLASRLQSILLLRQWSPSLLQLSQIVLAIINN